MNKNATIPISLEPLGKKVNVKVGTSLKDVLFNFGVEFPCGGEGICRGCLVKILKGNLKLNSVQEQMLSDDEIRNGYRLACQCIVTEPVTIELMQFETSILSDDAEFKAEPIKGLGVAVDLGTTTLVAQLMNMQTGKILGVRTALNPQAKYGADIMSRIKFALTKDGAKTLCDLIRQQIGEMIVSLIDDSSFPELPLRKITIVGNTVMHHLFNAIDIQSLSRYPFESEDYKEYLWKATDLGWQFFGNPEVAFLPCLGGFVGSDILAGILAVNMHKSDEIIALIDIGTNGEVVVGNKERILCASTAAGPAFEGAKISMGMRASTGAISKVFLNKDRMTCEVIGNGNPKGICGSGFVDAVACGLRLSLIEPSGRISNGQKTMEIAPQVSLTQRDIRELQLAKGAIAAGVEILFKRIGLRPADAKKIYLAGAFGNYINFRSAIRIGLLNFNDGHIEQAGNTALRGAKLALFHMGDYSRILSKVEHVPLASDPEFQEIFATQMSFPAVEVKNM